MGQRTIAKYFKKCFETANENSTEMSSLAFQAEDLHQKEKFILKPHSLRGEIYIELYSRKAKAYWRTQQVKQAATY